MRYLLDTNVLCNLEKRSPNRNLKRWIESTPASSIFVPTSVIFEIRKGIECARIAHADRAAEREEWLDSFLADSIFDIVYHDTNAARRRGKMVCVPRLKDFLVQPAGSKKIKTGEDLAIAAVAISLGA